MTRIRQLAFACSVAAVAGCGSPASPAAPSTGPRVAATAEPGPSAVSPASSAGVRLGPSIAGDVVVDRGGFAFTGQSSLVSLRGTRGFTLSAHPKASDVIIAIEDPCETCPPAVLIPVLAVQTGSSVTAKVTLDGVTYTDVGGSTEGRVSLQFAATSVPPPAVKGGVVKVSTPFHFVGEFAHADGSGGLVTESLSGRGIAKASLVWRDGRWFVESLSYTFEP